MAKENNSGSQYNNVSKADVEVFTNGIYDSMFKLMTCLDNTRDYAQNVAKTCGSDKDAQDIVANLNSIASMLGDAIGGVNTQYKKISKKLEKFLSDTNVNKENLSADITASITKMNDQLQKLLK